MKPRMILKIFVDLVMTVLLLLLMAYLLVGEEAHEWIGLAMFCLFIFHHVLNWKWHGNLFRGKYTFLRMMQTLLNILLLAAMIGLMASGIILSREVFDFLPISGGMGFARTLLLGIFAHEPAFGTSLEHDHGNDAESSRRPQQFNPADMGAADPGSWTLDIWNICIYKK